MEELVISDYSQMNSLFQQLTTDVSWFENKEVKLSDSLGGFKIHVEGDVFDSTITTGIMRGMLSLQNAVYDAYSHYCYGYVKRLSDEERKMLEIRVKIEPGSSYIEILIKDIAKAVGDRIRTMTTKEFIASVAIVSTIAAVSLNVGKHIDSKKEIARIQAQNELVTDVQKTTNEVAIAALEAQSSFYRSMSKQDFTSFSINNETVTPVEIAEMTKITREKRPVEQVVYKGKFTITDIHFEEETIYLDVINPTDGKTIKYVNIFKDIVTEDDYQWFKDSANRQSIDMTIVATEKKGEIIGAFLQSFKK
ncbi:hypothetical protein K7J14_08490 [Treponema zuelzerae]|uniref:Uncharacterized protein n=1 Tax=Teretinema zuelzerae TaxID=156 RepID=A0AAE3EHW7_9SPIR|nr:hypothetical protein [Teretinema zuelzerae]MCD1654742.1 hypothetical protein [Teretinema zuelzerae]